MLASKLNHYTKMLSSYFGMLHFLLSYIDNVKALNQSAQHVHYQRMYTHIMNPKRVK